MRDEMVVCDVRYVQFAVEIETVSTRALNGRGGGILNGFEDALNLRFAYRTGVYSGVIIICLLKETHAREATPQAEQGSKQNGNPIAIMI